MYDQLVNPMKNKSACAVIGFILAFSVARSFGVYFVESISSQIPSKVGASLGWSAKALELVNDERRISGKHPFFSELPNASYYFTYKVRTMDDVNELVAKLGEIDTAEVNVVLDPRDGSTFLEGETRAQVPVQLSIESQKLLDQWFSSLTSAQREKFRTHAQPIAPPPTLVVFVGNPLIDLSELNLPTNAKLQSTVRDWQAKDSKLSEPIERINRFMNDWQLKHPTTAPATLPAVKS